MSEKTLWKWLKPYMPRGKYDRIETGDTAPGTPDVHYRIQTAGGWIELKDCPREKDNPFPNDKKGLHKSQKDWISDYVLLGGIAWIVARVGDKIYWVHGTYARSFNRSRLSRIRAWSSLIIDTKSPQDSYRKIKRLLEGDHK